VSADRAAALRSLPSVDQLVRRVAADPALAGLSRARLTAAVREALDAERRRVREQSATAADPDTLAARVVEGVRRAGRFSLRPVVNATGVVLHTNLGRALLSDLARERVAAVAAAYSNLEMDLASKERGSRYSHVEALLRRLTGAEDALVVNNNAAAVLLALETLAHGKEVIVSRGELIEIGGEFRIPDIMLRSGAVLREVGATNRTHLRDYADAIGPGTALLLKVHTSNYRVIGFTAEVSSRELVELGHARGIAVMEDLGSGSLVDLRPWGFPYEPTVPEVVASGVDLVSFSGDKLLGGPQAGIVVGKRAIVSRLKKNPWNRALRIDKFTIAALEGTLTAYEDGTARETVPTLRLLTEHAWPGNVRELKNAMDYLAATVTEPVLEPESLPRSILPEAAAAPLSATPAPPEAAPLGDLYEEIRQLERRRIAEALEAAGGVQVKAAELIGMPLRTFAGKVRLYGLLRK